MKGYLKYITTDGKRFKLTKEITVKEAQQYYINKLKDRTDIREVYMVKFDVWSWRVCKVFKQEEKTK